MAKVKVGIGITTYADIRSPDFGRAFYDALTAASPKLAPYRIETLLGRFDVDGREDFAAHWCIEVRHVVQPKYGTAPSYVPPSDYGADWKTKGTLSGYGNVFFGGRDPNADSTLILEHNYSAKVDWATLFGRLIALFRPSHANLHVFTERELEMAGEGRLAFRGPVAGEGSFTLWQSSTGHWRGPDPWEVSERRRYRFLPDLAWANYLGDEFAGRFDLQRLIDLSSASEKFDTGVLFQVTDRIDDVVTRPDLFESKRADLRTAFADDVFRIDHPDPV